MTIVSTSELRAAAQDTELQDQLGDYWWEYVNDELDLWEPLESSEENYDE